MLYQALINKCSVLSDCIPPMGYKHENKNQILKQKRVQLYYLSSNKMENINKIIVCFLMFFFPF